MTVSRETPLRVHRALEILEASDDVELAWLALQIRRLVAGVDSTFAGVSRAAWRTFLYERRDALLREAHAWCGSLDELVVAVELLEDDELDEPSELVDALRRAAALSLGFPKRRALANAVQSTTYRLHPGDEEAVHTRSGAQRSNRR